MLVEKTGAVRRNRIHGTIPDCSAYCTRRCARINRRFSDACKNDPEVNEAHWTQCQPWQAGIVPLES